MKHDDGTSWQDVRPIAPCSNASCEFHNPNKYRFIEIRRRNTRFALCTCIRVYIYAAIHFVRDEGNPIQSNPIQVNPQIGEHIPHNPTTMRK